MKKSLVACLAVVLVLVALLGPRPCPAFGRIDERKTPEKVHGITGVPPGTTGWSRPGTSTSGTGRRRCCTSRGPRPDPDRVGAARRPAVAW
jgi:hypothetical protein